MTGKLPPRAALSLMFPFFQISIKNCDHQKNDKRIELENVQLHF